jgi:hypothetical protein
MDRSNRAVLDRNATGTSMYAGQEQSANNGHFEPTCNCLLLFNGEGECLAAMLRPDNVHSAKGREELLLPESEQQHATGKKSHSGPTRPMRSVSFIRHWKKLRRSGSGQRQSGTRNCRTAATPGRKNRQEALGRIEEICLPESGLEVAPADGGER